MSEAPYSRSVAVGPSATGANPLVVTASKKEPPMSGADLIAAERQRQIDVEGYTPEHDIEHGNDALAWAAVCYAAPETVYRVENRQVGNQNDHLVRYWEPWPAHWRRGTYDNGFRFEDNRVRNLVKAGALIAAEIDRLQAAANDGSRAHG